MRTLFFTALVLIASSAFGQNPNKLSFELGAGINDFAMTRLNRYYVDSFAVKNGLLQEGVRRGLSGFGSIRYRPKGLFDIGLYGNFQMGRTAGQPPFVLRDDYGIPVDTLLGTFSLRAQSIGVGITNSWFISHLLKFHEKKSRFLQNFRIATELNLGVGFSRVIGDTQFEQDEFNYDNNYSFFTSTDFQGQVALKIEYDYMTSPLIGTVGIKFGYQYLRTRTVTDRTGREWRVLGEYPINLDFSGLFGAVYLAFGK